MDAFPKVKKLTSLLGISVPILQAPIGSVSDHQLAGQVSSSGGLGALALSWRSRDSAVSEVQKTQGVTCRPFQVNFVLERPLESLPEVLDLGVQVVTFSWGIPGSESSLIKSYNAVLGVQVSSVLGAKKALDAGCDFLICQGVEAGGHVQSSQSLWKLLPEMRRHFGDFPIVAAGGLSTPNHIVRALNAGASGVMMGTRFVASQESRAHSFYKERLLGAAADETALTTCFDLSWPGAMHRVLRNSTLDEWESLGCPGSGRVYDDTPPLTGTAGSVERMCLFAGQGCGEIRDILTIEELVATMWAAVEELAERCA